jgi:hypothetical protein
MIEQPSACDVLPGLALPRKAGVPVTLRIGIAPARAKGVQYIPHPAARRGYVDEFPHSLPIHFI